MSVNRFPDTSVTSSEGSAWSPVDLAVSAVRAEELRRMSCPSIVLDETGLCDLELLGNGAFAPLRGFMVKRDYESVRDTMRLTDGTLWPIPICLTAPERGELREGGMAGLRNVEGVLLGVLHVDEIFECDPLPEMRVLYGTEDVAHPGVARLKRRGKVGLGGRVELVTAPPHYDFARLRLTPAQARARFAELGWARVLGVHTEAHLSRVHETWMTRAAAATDAGLFVHPAVGTGFPGDWDAAARVRGYRAVIETAYRPGDAVLALLPLATRWAGAREALWHALIRKNFGCTHFLVLPRHGQWRGAVGASSVWAGAELMEAHRAELGIEPVRCEELVIPPGDERVAPRAHAPAAPPVGVCDEVIDPAAARSAETLPSWMVRPEIVGLLRRTYRPRHEDGFCLWLTGLSGSGKSTLTKALLSPLSEFGRRVTLLDGDEIRTHLSKGLGFSKEDRDTNIRRVGFVAGQVVRHGGAVLCACISPYRAVRDEVRAMCDGRFIEVFCNTPLDVCAARDVKGLYAKALRGEIKGVTGVDDPYEAPERPELEYDSSRESIERMVDRVVGHLVSEGYLTW